MVCPVPLPTGDTDLFGTASAPSLKEPPKPEQPTPGKSSYLPASSGLFDDDDDDDFFAASHSKPSKTGTASASVSGNFVRKRMLTEKRHEGPLVPYLLKCQNPSPSVPVLALLRLCLHGYGALDASILWTDLFCFGN